MIGHHDLEETPIYLHFHGATQRHRQARWMHWLLAPGKEKRQTQQKR